MEEPVEHACPLPALGRRRGMFRGGRLTVPLRTLRRVLGAAAHAPIRTLRSGTVEPCQEQKAIIQGASHLIILDGAGPLPGGAKRMSEETTNKPIGARFALDRRR